MEKNLFAHYMHRCCTLFSLVCQYNRREEQIRLITLLYCSVAENNYPTIAHKVISITDRFMPLFSLYLFASETFVNIDVVNFWPHFSKKQQYIFRKRIFKSPCIFLMSLIIFQVLLKRLFLRTEDYFSFRCMFFFFYTFCSSKQNDMIVLFPWPFAKEELKNS